MATAAPKQKHDTPSRNSALKAATWDALTKRKPAEVELPLLLEPDIATEVDRAQEAVNAAETVLELAERRPGPLGGATPAQRKALTDAKAELAELEARAREATVVLRLRELPRLAYQGLQDAWPAREGNERDTFLGNNMDEFPPRLIAACLIEPEPEEGDAGVEQVRKLLDDFPPSEALNLVNQAIFLNTRRRIVDLGKG